MNYGSKIIIKVIWLGVEIAFLRIIVFNTDTHGILESNQ